MIKPVHRAARLLKVTAPMWAPLLLIVAAYQLAELFPGQVKVTHWRAFSSLCFVIAGLVAVIMVWRSSKPVASKIGLSVLLAPGFLFLAFMLSVRSRCGDEPVFIGPSGKQVASSACGE